MSVGELLAQLARQDIEVRLDGDQLRLSAPAGALNDSLRGTLCERKIEIVHFLRAAQALATQQRAIVPLQPKGTRVPIFGVPGHNGDVFCYREFTHALGQEQPFYGLQPPGLDGNSAPLTTVEELARYFAAQIRAFHRPGPCIIAGFCGGGVIAFELARELQDNGVTVNFLALIGAPYPTFFVAPSFRRRVLHKFERVGQHARELALRSWLERRRYIVEALRGARKEVDGPLDEVLRCRAQVEGATLGAVRRYRPRYFAGRVCLLLPSKYWASAGFGALDWRNVAQRTETYFGPDGSNGDNMLLGPRAHAFAALLRRACNDGAPELSVVTRDMVPQRAMA